MSQEGSLGAITGRSDRIGATARVITAIENDERPDEDDLKAIDWPIPWKDKKTLQRV